MLLTILYSHAQHGRTVQQGTPYMPSVHEGHNIFDRDVPSVAISSSPYKRQERLPLRPRQTVLHRGKISLVCFSLCLPFLLQFLDLGRGQG